MPNNEYQPRLHWRGLLKTIGSNEQATNRKTSNLTAVLGGTVGSLVVLVLLVLTVVGATVLVIRARSIGVRTSNLLNSGSVKSNMLSSLG